MLKCKSTKQLFVAAYFLMLLLPCKCFSHQTAKGRAYISNPFTTEDVNSIFLGDVKISYSWGADQALIFFEVNMIDPEFGISFTLIQNSPPLLQALNQAIHFGHVDGLALDGPLPDFQMPLLFDEWPRFNVLLTRRMGRVNSIKNRNVGSNLRLRTYWADDTKLLGIISAQKNVGPLRNLIAISFGGGYLYIRIVSKLIDNMDIYYGIKKKELDVFKRPDSDDGGGLLLVN